MTLNDAVKNWLAQNAGTNNCYVSSGIAYNDPDGIARTGGTGDVLNAFYVAHLLGKDTVIIRASTNYSSLKTINGGADAALDDVTWVYNNDGNPAGQAQYCYVPPTTGNISFSTIPTGAKITVDGVDTGKVTNDTVSGLTAITHLWTLKKAGYKDEAGQTDVIANQTVSVSRTLTQVLTSEEITLSETLSNYNCYGFTNPIDTFAGTQGDKRVVAIYATGDCVSMPVANPFNWYLWDIIQLAWSFYIQTPAIATNPGFARTEVDLPSNAMYKVSYGTTEKIFTIGAGQIVEFGVSNMLLGIGTGVALVWIATRKKEKKK